jgi:ribosome-binding factor A
MKSKRTHRVAELIQATVAQALRRETRDPRLSTVTITGVDLSPDFKQAIVFFTLLDADEKSIADAEKAFEKAAGFFRVQVSNHVELRHTPQLFFKYDVSLLKAEKLSQLINNTE